MLSYVSCYNVKKKENFPALRDDLVLYSKNISYLSAKSILVKNNSSIYNSTEITYFQIFFVLRKKDSQVSFLHLYHHSLTPLETWICVKFIAGGHGTLGNLINNAVHVIMYLYYMVSAMGPEYQKYLWWKKHLTTVQLVGRSIYETSERSFRKYFILSCYRRFVSFRAYFFADLLVPAYA